MIYVYHQHEARKYLRKDNDTMKEEIVSVTNFNRLSIEKHIELLNLNSPDYEYISFLGTVDVKE